VNCAAIPDELIESELFGYEPGAFSGASPKGKKGLIEEAAGGTLFLDEVGDLSAEAQAKLLRFLDSGQFYKVGGTRPRASDARVVSATNRDLEAMIADGGFRSDLYYRLGVIRVEVPSLERRPEDVLPIARHFLVELAEKYGKAIAGLTPEAEEALRRRAWPGNVRELKAVMERAVLAARGPRIGPEELAGPGPAPAAEAGPAGAGRLPPLTPEGLDLGAVLEEAERVYLERALELAGGSDARAAELLGLNYHTLRYRKKKLGLG
jgi:transcriptional regulator with PAS, ATPase and Fis domain